MQKYLCQIYFGFLVSFMATSFLKAQQHNVASTQMVSTELVSRLDSQRDLGSQRPSIYSRRFGIFHVSMRYPSMSKPAWMYEIEIKKVIISQLGAMLSLRGQQTKSTQTTQETIQSAQPDKKTDEKAWLMAYLTKQYLIYSRPMQMLLQGAADTTAISFPNVLFPSHDQAGELVKFLTIGAVLFTAAELFLEDPQSRSQNGPMWFYEKSNLPPKTTRQPRLTFYFPSDKEERPYLTFFPLGKKNQFPSILYFP